jgi:hypothetical protein
MITFTFNESYEANIQKAVKTWEDKEQGTGRNTFSLFHVCQ